MSKISDPEVLAAQAVLIRYYRELLNEFNYHGDGLTMSSRYNQISIIVVFENGAQRTSSMSNARWIDVVCFFHDCFETGLAISGALVAIGTKLCRYSGSQVLNELAACRKATKVAS